MIELTIPRLPKSPNSLRARHWSVKHRDKKDWDTQIMVQIRDFDALFPGMAPKVARQERRAVAVRLFYSKQPMDPDNLHGSIKPILDALKANRLIYDDAEEWLSYTVTQQKVATVKEARTEISISAGISFLSPETDR